MLTIPFRHLIFHSELSPSKIESRLAEIVMSSPPIFLWSVPAGKRYSGDIAYNSFSLKRLWGYGPKNLWSPTFRGVINRSPVGSDINVTVSLEGFDFIVIIAYHLFFLAVIFLGLKVSFVLFLFMFLIFALADGLGYYLSFIQGVRSFEAEIKSVLSKD